MPDESQAAQASKKKPRQPRVRSTIEFPYLDLDNAIEIARAMRDLGSEDVLITQLATKLNVAADGGGFRMRLFNAKTFGLLTYERGKASLTDLGIRIIDPLAERRSRYEAFLSVGLFKLMFSKLDGQNLPPPAAIERMMELAGVAVPQKERARQVFLRSAKQAGFLELSSDRLSTPPSLGSPRAASQAIVSEAVPSDQFGGGGGDDGDGGDSETERFEIPIPGKRSVRVIVPRDLDADDWTMLQSMITVYINRWKGFKKDEAK